MRESGITFRPALPGWAALALAAGLVLLAVWAYRRTTRPVSLRLRALLIGLRLVAAGALLACLLRPAMETITYTVEKQPLIFLIDESRSMSHIRDAAGGASRLEAIREALSANSTALQRLREKYDVRTFSFARELLTEGNRTELSTSYSAYGRALRDALKATRLGQCDGIVLMGDGSHNLGPPDPMDVAIEMVDRGIPLYSVGVGRERPGQAVRDVKIVSLDAPRRAYVFSTFSVRGRILFRGCRGLKVRVRMEFPGHGMQFQTVRVAHEEEIVPVEFQLTPEALGEFKLTMRAQEQPDEMLRDNNARSAFVHVVSSGLRVGYFDSLRPEGKFVFHALRGARQINIVRMIVSARLKPSDAETNWERYDVVMIGDIPALCFTGEALKELKKAVQDEGKGFILLAGAQSTGVGGFGGTFLEDILPVRLPRTPQYAAGQRHLRVVPTAADHPVLALGESKAETLERWQQMPPLSGAVAGVTVKSGAEVLARDEEGLPLVCLQRSGAGRVACVLTDTTFRWFFTEADTQQDHRRFWRQLVLWAGAMDEKPQEQFWITLNKTQVGVGEPVSVQAHLVGPDSAPVRDAKVRLTVQTPGGEGAELASLFSREEGCFQAEYTPGQAGEYVVRGEALRAGKAVGRDAAFFQAFSADRELEDPTANLSLLRRLSAATAEAGGEYHFYSDLDLLLDELADTAHPLMLTTRRWRDIWDNASLFAVFLVALAAEWAVRKWRGLV